MPLTSIEYNVIMQAIYVAKTEILSDTFIDPHAEKVEGYTNKSLMDALERVEDKIIRDNIPF